VFERFTERARQVVVLAQDESRNLKHHYIGTEHLLLGLLREEQGLAATALSSLGITLEGTRAEIVSRVGEGDQPITSGQIPFTPRAKKVLELSLREALSLNHNYIATEHILLGLIRENEGVAAHALQALGAEADTVCQKIIRLLSLPGYAPEPISPPGSGTRPLQGIPPAQWRLPPLSDNLRQVLTAALDSVEAAKKTAKAEKDHRRMAIIAHTERLLERLLNQPPAETTEPDTPST
jgi:ATP-dependent Clp protease ATP-binding subunit ClpC